MRSSLAAAVCGAVVLAILAVAMSGRTPSASFLAGDFLVFQQSREFGTSRNCVCCGRCWCSHHHQLINQSVNLEVGDASTSKDETGRRVVCSGVVTQCMLDGTANSIRAMATSAPLVSSSPGTSPLQQIIIPRRRPPSPAPSSTDKPILLPTQVTLLTPLNPGADGRREDYGTSAGFYAATSTSTPPTAHARRRRTTTDSARAGSRPQSSFSLSRPMARTRPCRAAISRTWQSNSSSSSSHCDRIKRCGDGARGCTTSVPWKTVSSGKSGGRKSSSHDWSTSSSPSMLLERENRCMSVNSYLKPWYPPPLFAAEN